MTAKEFERTAESCIDHAEQVCGGGYVFQNEKGIQITVTWNSIIGLTPFFGMVEFKSFLRKHGGKNNVKNLSEKAT